jgi:hypothetical protein
MAQLWKSDVALRLLKQGNLALMRDGEMMHFLKSLTDHLPYISQSPEATVAVVTLLGTVPWRRDLAYKCFQIYPCFIQLALSVVKVSSVCLVPVLEAVLRPFLLTDVSEKVLDQQRHLAVELLPEVLRLYPAELDVLSRTVIPACFPQRRFPDPSHHVQYIRMLLEVILNDATAESFGASTAETQLTTSSAGQVSASTRLAVAQRGVASRLRTPRQQWEGFRESILILILNRISEMEMTCMDAEISLDNLLALGKAFAAILSQTAKKHAALEAAGSAPRPMWWPPILLQYYKEKLPRVVHQAMTTNLLIPSILSHVGGMPVLDLLHGLTSLVIKEVPLPVPLSLDTRIELAKHLYPLHHLLQHCPSAKDYGLLRRTSKWIERAMTVEENASANSAAAGGASNRPGERRSGASSVVALRASGSGAKVEDGTPAVKPTPVFPPSFIALVYRHHKAACALYAVEDVLAKDITAAHLQRLESGEYGSEPTVKGTAVPPLPPSPYDLIPFEVFGAKPDPADEQYQPRAQPWSVSPAPRVGLPREISPPPAGAPLSPVPFGAGRTVATGAVTITKKAPGSNFAGNSPHDPRAAPPTVVRDQRVEGQGSRGSGRRDARLKQNPGSGSKEKRETVRVPKGAPIPLDVPRESSAESTLSSHSSAKASSSRASTAEVLQPVFLPASVGLSTILSMSTDWRPPVSSDSDSDSDSDSTRNEN